MPASDHPTTGLYLRGLLAAGARPFAPPGGVYRLLGQAPPQRTAVRFPPPLPPVGFVYEGLARLRPGPAGIAGSAALGQEESGAESYPGPRSEAGRLAAPVRPQRTAPLQGGTGEGGGRAASASGAPHRPDGAVTSAPSVGERLARREEPPGGSASVERAAVQRATDPPCAETRTGLAIPGLTERRAIFAALAGGLPHDESDGAPPASSTPAPSAPAPAGASPRLISESATSERPSPSQALRPSGAIRATATPARTPAVEVAAFRAQERVVAEVEHVRRAVAAQADRVTPEAVREAAREAVREAVREEKTEGRSERRPDRRDAPAPAPVVVVQRVEGGERRAPRAFWSSSALRSPHLRMLR